MNLIACALVKNSLQQDAHADSSSLFSERQDANPLVNLSYKLAGTHAALRFIEIMNSQTDCVSACVPYRSRSGVRETRKYRLAIFFVEPVMQLNGSVKVAVASCFQLSRVSALIFMPRLEKWRTQLLPLPLDSTCICT